MATREPIGTPSEPVDLLEVAQQGESFCVFRGEADQEPLVFDLTTEEIVSEQVEISDAPIETGSDVADHVRRAPRVVSFRGLLVDAPFDPGTTRARGLAVEAEADPTALVRFFPDLSTLRGQMIAGITRGPAIDPTRAKGELDRLRSLLGAEPVILVTAYDVHQNMVLKDLNHQPAGRGAVQVSGSFREVAFAKVATVELPPEPQEKKDKGKTNKGTQAPKPTTPEQRQSAASRLLELVR
jgi:hypothetical protein